MSLVQYTPPSNPGYNAWTQRDGEFYLLSGNTAAKLYSAFESEAEIEDIIKASFTTTAVANNSQLSVRVATYCPSPESNGKANYIVWLKKPGGTYVKLTEGGGGGGTPQWVLYNYNIASYLDAAGTYELQLQANCISDDQGGGIWTRTWVEFTSVDLRIDQDVPAQVPAIWLNTTGKTTLHASWTGVSGALSYKLYYKQSWAVTWTSISGITDLYYDLSSLTQNEYYNAKVAAVNASGEGPTSPVATARTNYDATKTLTETASFLTEIFDTDSSKWVELTDPLGLVETFETMKVNLVLVDLTEPLGLQEAFQVRKFSPLSSKSSKLLAGVTSGEVKDFVSGNDPGTWDTDDLDFDRPGEDKILDHIEFLSHSLVPHTIFVSVSTDNGLTWTSVGQDIVYTGKHGVVSPWVTGEKFRLRFYGESLHLFDVYATAIPVGGILDKETAD